MAKHAQRNALLRYQGKRIVRAKVNVKVKGKKKRKTVIKIKTIPIVNDFYYKPMRTAKYYFGINKIYTFALSAGVNNKTVLKGYKKAQQTKKSK